MTGRDNDDNKADDSSKWLWYEVHEYINFVYIIYIQFQNPLSMKLLMMKLILNKN
jgi:hypothetical protein